MGFNLDMGIILAFGLTTRRTADAVEVYFDFSGIGFAVYT